MVGAMVATLQIGEQVLETERVMSVLQRYQMLPQVLRGLVIDEAIANQTYSPEERQQAIAIFQQQQRITTAEEQALWLQRHYMTLAQLEELALRPLLVAKFKMVQWNHQAEAHFLKRKRELDQVVYSLIRTKDFGLANELYFRILEGEQTFEAVASQYSLGAEAQANGLIGPVAISQPHPAIAKFLTSAQPGKLCPPAVLGEWVIVLRLEKRLPAVFDDAMRQRMVDELFELWLQSQVEAKMGEPALHNSSTNG
jgi:parvulin-like peptidyl-prolyl isomerase